MFDSVREHVRADSMSSKLPLARRKIDDMTRPFDPFCWVLVEAVSIVKKVSSTLFYIKTNVTVKDFSVLNYLYDFMLNVCMEPAFIWIPAEHILCL